MRNLLLLAASALAIISLSSCEPQPPVRQKHVLEGAWLATDGTIFNFRSDGTFHGIDFRKKEIWGNWVALSETRIGFQSLLHDSSYRPQYAVISKKSNDAMDYIVTGGTNFIPAKRIPPAKADAAIELTIEPELILPDAMEPHAD